MTKDKYGVVTIDIVNSTQLGYERLSALLSDLKDIINSKYLLSDFYRGDSFQFVCGPEFALQYVLILRTYTIAANAGKHFSDLRVGIGIGQGNIVNNNLAESYGDCFTWSGRALDQLTSGTDLTMIVSKDRIADCGFEALSLLLDTLFSDMTQKQAQIIYLLLAGNTQQGIADKLNKSQSTVNRVALAGNWHGISRCLNIFKELINQLYR